MLKSTGTLNLSMFSENWDVVVTNEFQFSKSSMMGN